MNKANLETSAAGHSPVDPDTMTRLFGIDFRTLALFRVMLAAVVAGSFGVRSWDIDSLYTDDGALPVEFVRQQLQGTWYFSFHFLDGSWGFQVFLFSLAGVLALLLGVGWHTRAATVMLWLLHVSLNNRVPLLTNGGDALLNMLLLWSVFLPLGARWSLDARRSRNAPQAGCELSIATLAVLLQVFWMYWSTSLWKWNSTWLGGEALAMAFSDDLMARPLGKWLLNYPGMLSLMTWASLALELLGPFLLFSPWRTKTVRSWTLLAFVGLHVGIELTLNVLVFSYASLTALVLFVPDTWWSARPLRGVAAWLDSKLPAGGRRAPRADDRSFRLPPRVTEAVQVLLLLYVPLYNISYWINLSRPVPTFDSFNRLGEFLGAGQVWSMFDRPPGDERFATVAQLQSGLHYDTFRSVAVTAAPERPSQPAPMDSARWRFLLRQITNEPFAGYRRPVTEYFGRVWNAQAKDGQRAIQLVLVHYPAPHESAEQARFGRTLVTIPIPRE